MPALVLHFSLHSPVRLRTDYHFFQIGKDHRYEDEGRTRSAVENLVRRSTLPTNQVLYDLIRRHEGRFRISFSLSGVLLDELVRFAPEAIDSFRTLVKTGCVEIVGGTYYHSLACLYSLKEFEAQVDLHKKKLTELFGTTPTAFCNTGLLYRNALAESVEKSGYKTLLIEGRGPHLGFHSAQKIYTAKDRPKLKLLLRDDRLTEDLSIRFGDPSWNEHPLTAEKYVSWIRNSVQGEDTANLFLNHDVFGLRHPKESGVYDFLWHLPGEALSQNGFQFQTPSESAFGRHAAIALDVPEWTSESEGRDLSSWKKNPMQESALEYLYSLEKAVLKSKNAGLLHQWRKFQSSDYFQAMVAGGNADRLGFPTPYDTYVVFVNILNDFKEQL